MFVSRKTHEAALALQRQGFQDAINCKNAHIDTLESEVLFLRRMVQPERSLSPKVAIEADLVLEGRQDQVTEDEIESERARLLSGTY